MWGGGKNIINIKIHGGVSHKNLFGYCIGYSSKCTIVQLKRVGICSRFLPIRAKDVMRYCKICEDLIEASLWGLAVDWSDPFSILCELIHAIFPSVDILLLQKKGYCEI